MKLVVQLVSGQRFQNREHGGCLGLGGGQVHVAVVAAFHFAGTGDSALKGRHEAEGLHRQLQRFGRGKAAREQIEAGAAAHGADVDDAVPESAVPRVGGEQVLQCVGGPGGEIIAVVRLLHPDVPGEHIAVLTAQVHAAVQFGVVHAETCDPFHLVHLSGLQALDAAVGAVHSDVQTVADVAAGTQGTHDGECAIRKDGGDDVDVTTGLPVIASAALRPELAGEVRIHGGEGVGRVTKPGLDQPVGEAAINHVPRAMIKEALEKEAESAGYAGGFDVTISIEGGAETAKRTFNPHMGVEGGLSVLGTSGIVEPMSQQAILDTIQLEMAFR